MASRNTNLSKTPANQEAQSPEQIIAQLETKLAIANRDLAKFTESKATKSARRKQRRLELASTPEGIEKLKARRAKRALRRQEARQAKKASDLLATRNALASGMDIEDIDLEDEMDDLEDDDSEA